MRNKWQRVHDLVHIGEIGNVHAIFPFNLPDPKNIRNILADRSGGVMDIGCDAAASSRLLLESEPRCVVSLITRDPESGTNILSSAILDFGRTRTKLTVATQTQRFQHTEVIGSGGQISVPVCFNMYPDTQWRF